MVSKLAVLGLINQRSATWLVQKKKVVYPSLIRGLRLLFYLRQNLPMRFGTAQANACATGSMTRFCTQRTDGAWHMLCNENTEHRTHHDVRERRDKIISFCRSCPLAPLASNRNHILAFA